MLRHQRHSSDRKIDGLKEAALFARCRRSELERVAQIADETTFPAGATLMEEGRPGHEAFVLLEGTADVTIDGERVATVAGGDIVGEMALIEHEPRTATVTALEDVRALVLTSQGLDAMLDASPAVAREVMATLARRLRHVQVA